jgi:hypothetical protein
MQNNIKYTMKTSQIKTLGFFLILINVSSIIFAQESCTENLGYAHDAFERGQIDEVPKYLENCLSSGFTKEEKIAAYRLLTLCDLYYNRSEGAAINMQKMLKANPEYKLQDIDPSEFQKLYGNFRTTPVFIWGVKGGIGLVQLYDIRNYNDVNSDGSLGNYRTNPVYNAGFSVEAPISKSFSVALEAYYNSYQYTVKKNILNYANLNYNEKISGIEMPLLFQMNILKDQKVIPYVNAGASFCYMISATGKIARTDTLIQYPDHEPTNKEFDMLKSRNRFNYGVSGTLGVRIKDVIGKGYMTFDIRYSRYFNDHVDENHRADTPESTYGFLQTDNSFKIHNIQFFIGYKTPVYFPKLKRSIRKDIQKESPEN